MVVVKFCPGAVVVFVLVEKSVVVKFCPGSVLVLVSVAVLVRVTGSVSVVVVVELSPGKVVVSCLVVVRF